jgi:D-3-phosphoglycerate dehydrogenase
VKRKKIIICDTIHEKGFKLLEKESDIDIIDATETNKDKLHELMGDSDVAITRSPTDIDAKFLDAGKKLSAVIRAGVGVDNVDIDECSKRGVIVMNVPTANTIAAVELTMTHILSTARMFPYAHNALKHDRTWKREKWYGVELFGKKLGVIGFGNIGSRVAVRAKSFGMDIVAYDPYIPSNKVTELDMTYTENFDDILACDFITIHTPKNKETINIIDKAEIAKMKNGVRLINVARGGLYNEEALVEGLKSGKIAFAGIDVFSKEPALDNPILDLDNVTVTPHLGANTFESQEKIAIQAAEQALSAVRGISYPNALNLPIKTEDLPSSTAPYLELVQKISFLAAQIYKRPILGIHVEGEGTVGEYLDSFLTFAIVGALKESLGDNINYVNAGYMAADKKIDTSSKVLPASGYSNKVSVKISTDKGVAEVSGTVFGEDEQRIVSINGFKTDFKPKGKMIVFKNRDVPGVIASISTLLAQNNINIADFRLGRGSDGLALAVILVDQDISRELLAKLNELPNCIWAQSVNI